MAIREAAKNGYQGHVGQAVDGNVYPSENGGYGGRSGNGNRDCESGNGGHAGGNRGDHGGQGYHPNPICPQYRNMQQCGQKGHNSRGSLG